MFDLGPDPTATAIFALLIVAAMFVLFVMEKYPRGDRHRGAPGHHAGDRASADNCLRGAVEFRPLTITFMFLIMGALLGAPTRSRR